MLRFSSYYFDNLPNFVDAMCTSWLCKSYSPMHYYFWTSLLSIFSYALVASFLMSLLLMLIIDAIHSHIHQSNVGPYLWRRQVTSYHQLCQSKCVRALKNWKELLSTDVRYYMGHVPPVNWLKNSTWLVRNDIKLKIIILEYYTWLSVMTQNNYCPLKFCHVSCSHSPSPACIPHENYIPTYVKMK